jgi:F-type H+-transporting ATPase subunit a
MMETISVGVHPHWHLWNLTFNADTLISAWIVSAFLIALALIVRAGLKRKPGRLQTAVEMGLESINGLLSDRLKEKGKKYFPLIATLFLFILASNWLGILPFDLKSPTADINTTASLAILVIVLVQIFGIIEKGLFKYLHKFVEPNPMFLILNVMEEIAKPFSLAVRLFGNMFSKETILVVLTALVAVPLLYPIPILALGLLVGAIQAYVFALLAVFYISMAVEGH